jgi:hypothetical protein
MSLSGQIDCVVELNMHCILHKHIYRRSRDAKAETKTKMVFDVV